MLCNVCKAIDFRPLDEFKNKAEIVRDRTNEAFLFTPPNFYNDPEICQWRDGEGVIQGYYFHHETSNALLDSARSGCHLCAVMSFALFDKSVTISELDYTLQAMPDIQYPVVLATVLYPDHRHWREDPRCKLIRTYCETYECRLDILDVHEGNPLIQTYQKLCQTLELAWEHRDIEPHLSTWSQLNLKLATSWSQDCLSNHRTCKVGKPLLPKRVIDVGGPTANAQPILLQPAGPTYGEYVTLSHCWGDGTPLVPVEIGELAGSWSLPPLATWEQTFQDAVAVVKSLDIRYLWIDAPCILQGPENRLDWETESVKMARYYQNATLCICATKARSSSDGLFSLRNPILTYPCRVDLPAQGDSPGFQRFLCAGREDLLLYYEEESDSSKSPIYSRAWCLQEEILSPRMLRFGHKRLHWRCLSMSHSEGFIGKSADALTRPDVHLQGANDVKMHMDVPEYTSEWGGTRNPYYDAWYRILLRLNLRNISYQNDILPAISGVAEALYPHLGHDEYLAGLWRGDITVGLLWSTADFDPARPPIGLSQKNFDKSSLYSPSWSWIGMAEKSLLVGSYKRLETTTKETSLAFLRSAQIGLKDKTSPFGLIESGTLIFMAQLPSIVITPDIKRKPLFHEEFYFAETSVKRSIQPRPNRRMEMCADDWELHSELKLWSSISPYQLIGQCDLDEYPLLPIPDVDAVSTSEGEQGSSQTIINASFLPLQTDRAEFGRVRTLGLLLVQSSSTDANAEYFKRIGVGKFDLGPVAWKACKLPLREVRLI